MKELNEKLAELCGKSCEAKGNDVYIMQPYRVRDNVFGYKEVKWNPAGGNLNQLLECYLALSDDEQGKCATHFAAALAESTGFRDTDPSTLGFYWLLNAIFKHPELVAQAILKAKEVE